MSVKTKKGTSVALKRKAPASASKNSRILIRNGTIHTAADSFRADLSIRGGKIVQIASGISPAQDEMVIDASGLEIYPGGIDVHTHFDLPFMGTVSADDFESGSIAAACGGTTTLVDFIIPAKGKPLADSVKVWHAKAAGKCAIDYGFHLALVEFNDKVAAELPQIIKEGITSFKCFLAYKGALMIDDAAFLGVLELSRKHGALVSVHAENGDMLVHLTNHLVEAKKTSPRYHAVAHPAIAEGEATHRALTLARLAGAPLYIVHLSCLEALEEVKIARASGQFILAETCPQYLLLDEELYLKPGFEGAKWVMSPPLREVDGQDRLWEGLRDGFIQTVATDHCSFNFKKQKEMGLKSFTHIPNGIPGVGDRMNLLYTYGVKHGRITPNQFAALTATNPARIFGMYPDKGTIAIGSDADLVLYDPRKKAKITAKTSHHRVDYSAYEGFELEGIPVLVLSRGEVVSRNQTFVGKRNHGKYQKRKKFNSEEWGY